MSSPELDWGASYVNVSMMPANRRWPMNASEYRAPPPPVGWLVPSTWTSAAVRSRTQFTLTISVRKNSWSQKKPLQSSVLIPSVENALVA